MKRKTSSGFIEEKPCRLKLTFFTLSHNRAVCRRTGKALPKATLSHDIPDIPGRVR